MAVVTYLCAIKFRGPHPLRGPTKQYRLRVPLNVFQSRSRGYNHAGVRLMRKQLVRLIRETGTMCDEGLSNGDQVHIRQSVSITGNPRDTHTNNANQDEGSHLAR